MSSYDDSIQQLRLEIKDLDRKEAKIRLELRSNGGHEGKVNDKVLVWLEQFDRIKIQFSNLTKEQGKISIGNSFSLLEVDKKVLKLVGEVKLLIENASSLLVIHARNHVDRVQAIQPSKTLIGQLARNISNEIWDYLMNPGTGRICLYGLGGVGKTTIMKNINNQLTNTDIFDKIIWVTLSKDMAIGSVQDSIADQLNIKLPTTRDLRTRATIITQHLKSLSRYLFILDNVCWEHVWLEGMGIPEPGINGCKIVLTTRFRALCIDMSVDRWMHLSPLSENEAWELFITKSGDQVLDPAITSYAKKLVNECGGLPITIITVGHAMRGEVNPTAWKLALTNLRKEVGEDAMQLLKFGYDHLKNDQIQKCFLYCALFPEGYNFDPSELIRYWMAEDFIQNENDILRSYDEGLEILRDLKEANMLETSVGEGNEKLKMHDLLRDLAFGIATEELRCFVRAGECLTTLPLSSEYKGAKRISLVRNHFTRLDQVWDSSLSTLLLKDNPLWQQISSAFDFIPNIEVLDLSFTGITNLPSSFCTLAKLRVLFLQYCTSLTHIPSVKTFKQLRVLNLQGTLITELPDGMKALVSLRSLDISDTVRLKNIETGVISSLFNLEELQMQRSSLCMTQSETVRNCFKEIRCLKNLAILTLSAVGSEDHLDTILLLQKDRLKRFLINVYGSASDYVDDV